MLYWGGQNVPGGVHVIVLCVLGTAGDCEDFLALGLKIMMTMVTVVLDSDIRLGRLCW